MTTDAIAQSMGMPKRARRAAEKTTRGCIFQCILIGAPSDWLRAGHATFDMLADTQDTQRLSSSLASTACVHSFAEPAVDYGNIAAVLINARRIMKQTFASLTLVFGIATAMVLPAAVQAQAAATSSESVTVVIQVAPIAGADKQAANTAMKNMIAMIKKQPGYVSDEFLQNNNPANTPSHVHVIRWASLKYWESVFVSPEFVKLNTTNAKLFSVTASAFKPVN